MKALGCSVLLILWACCRAQEINCPEPAIPHGAITNGKPVFRKDERLEFYCEMGYKSEGRTPECTEEGWNPKPFCKEIECYYQNVVNGEMLPRRDKYKQDDTVDLNCDLGFVALYSKDRKSTCTIDGWVPPLKCERKACDYPEIENGKLSSWNYRYYRNHYFPMTKGREIDYECDGGYATESGYGSGRITCSDEGWTPTPRCRRACVRSYFNNMDMFFEKLLYTEGQTVSFRCYPDFFTHEGQEAGTVECLSNGMFSQATCIRMCKLTLTGTIKSYKPKKQVFNVEDTVQYECNDGYHSYQSRIVDTSECTTVGWRYKPQCQEITCSLNVDSRGRTSRFKNGDVAKLKCQEGFKMEGAEKVQCYYFGWYPKLPSCIDISEFSRPEYLIFNDSDPADGREMECLEPPKLPNTEEQSTRSKYEHGETVVYTCKRNYMLYGSNTISCENGRWKSPPQCIERRSCSKPPTIINGKCLMPTSKNYFYSDDTVTYLCDPGYHITGLNESTCIGGRWTAPPTCNESPCNVPSIDHGSVIELRTQYVAGATVNFKCDSGYKVILQRQTQCLEGEWHFLPKCFFTSCGAAPIIKDGEFVDKPRQSYKAGERVTYRCKQGFVFKNRSYVICEDSQWTEPSVCLKEGSECGPVPFVHNGDITDFPQLSYPSGSTVEYKCQSYYRISGNNKVNCMHGAWSAPPECLEPCTPGPEEMAENNIRFRWSNEVKLYLEHDHSIEFMCLSNDYIRHEGSPPFRLKCIRGKILYPRCIRIGSCAPLSKEMDPKNIILMNENKEIKDGNTVEFTCKPGFYKKPNQVMRVKCTHGKLDYPECDSTPAVCSRPPSVPHGKVVGDVKNEYSFNSFIEYICDEGYVFKGTRMLTCFDGEWSRDVPQCIRLCQVTEEKLKEHFVELSLKQRDKMAFFEGDEITFTCISGFQVLAPPGILVANCSKAGFNYPTCFNPSSCILEQKELDQKNIKLLPGFANLQYATNGQVIEFSCKEGYIKHTRSSDLSQICEEGFIAYPICIRART